MFIETRPLRLSMSGERRGRSTSTRHAAAATLQRGADVADARGLDRRAAAH
jgi:hypothetical protein